MLNKYILLLKVHMKMKKNNLNKKKMKKKKKKNLIGINFKQILHLLQILKIVIMKYKKINNLN